MPAIAPRCLSLLLAAGAFALGACSGSGTGASSHAGSGAPAGSGASAGGRVSGGGAATSATLARLMVDQDSDATSLRGYYDGDDEEVRSYGHAADAADETAIGNVVGRYYAAAAADDAKTACALTYYLQLETLPERFAAGPLWLKSGRTCRQILGRLFAHFHAKLAEPPVLTAVRVQNNRARVLVGFHSLGAGYVELHREGGAWKVASLLAEQLP